MELDLVFAHRDLLQLAPFEPADVGTDLESEHAQIVSAHVRGVAGTVRSFYAAHVVGNARHTRYCPR